jgi:hypothetical protein
MHVYMYHNNDNDNNKNNIINSKNRCAKAVPLQINIMLH